MVCIFQQDVDHAILESISLLELNGFVAVTTRTVVEAGSATLNLVLRVMVTPKSWHEAPLHSVKQWYASILPHLYNDDDLWEGRSSSCTEHVYPIAVNVSADFIDG
jgi:hypothetical protein